VVYDVIIIGGGPAGLTAGLYAARSRLKTIIIEKDVDGGQIATTSDVENYPGVPADATGPSLVARWLSRLGLGAEKVSDEVMKRFRDKIKIVKGKEKEYQGRTVIIATGSVPRL